MLSARFRGSLTDCFDVLALLCNIIRLHRWQHEVSFKCPFPPKMLNADMLCCNCQGNGLLICSRTSGHSHDRR